MTRRRARDIASSVRQRLLDLSRTRNEDFQLIITRFASERLLYRLSQSNHAERFVLKGALLFALWTGASYVLLAMSTCLDMVPWGLKISLPFFAKCARLSWITPMGFASMQNP